MMNVTNFRLTLDLATPFYCPEPLTLDGLLSAAVFNATGLQGEATTPHIPLEREHGVFKGSSLFAMRNYQPAVVGRVMSFKGETDLSVHAFRGQMRRQKYGYIDQQRGDFKANLSAYDGILSREVYFWGRGDAEQVCHLISNFIPGIGKRANAGAGEIVGIHWHETEEDLSWMTAKGTPARPLPKAVWESIGGDPHPTAPFAVEFPYWKTQKVESVFPNSLSI